jgi:hypothetical protein
MFTELHRNLPSCQRVALKARAAVSTRFKPAFSRATARVASHTTHGGRKLCQPARPALAKSRTRGTSSTVHRQPVVQSDEGRAVPGRWYSTELVSACRRPAAYRIWLMSHAFGCDEVRRSGARSVVRSRGKISAMAPDASTSFTAQETFRHLTHLWESGANVRRDRYSQTQPGLKFDGGRGSCASPPRCCRAGAQNFVGTRQALRAGSISRSEHNVTRVS